MGAIRSNVMLKLGLFIFPVNVESAISEEKEASFTTLCDGAAAGKAHAPVKIAQKYSCPTCTREGGIKDFVKGKDRGDGTYVIVPQAEIDAAGVSDDMKNALALTVHSAEQVVASTTAAGKVYYLTPGKTAGETYPLVVDLVQKRPDLAFCTVWASRSVPHMYRLGVLNGALTLTELAWPDAVRPAPQVKQAYDPALMPLAEQFLDGLTAEFDPTTFRDTRQEVLAAFIASQEGVAAGDAPTAPTREQSDAPTLMDKLRAATAATPQKKPAKKAPAKTTGARRRAS